ncbi:MAG: hypothetical protein QOE90_939 [Thermoplasmata archaeon]|jgi:hypothetical protein|nr:hypothetical protein [Thermoplasmata archaeon]
MSEPSKQRSRWRWPWQRMPLPACPRPHGPPAAFYVAANGRLVLRCSLCDTEVVV